MSHPRRRPTLFARPLDRAITALAIAGLLVTPSPAHALIRHEGRVSARQAPVAKTPPGGSPARVPNELGRIPILEWHQVVDADGTYKVSRERFRAELTDLYARGYVPISLGDLLDKHIDLPVGKSPVLFTFDDASPSQFRYHEQGGTRVVDPTSAVGILLDFIKTHPEWKPRGLFCALPAAQAGHAFFGEKGIDGQQSAWRFPKLQFLVAQGFELCNHTLWHAKLSKYPDAFVQEQIARGTMAIDSAVPNYRVRGFALPYGLWPKNRALAVSGSWHGARGKREVKYSHDAVFLVTGGPARSPYDPQFNARALPRVPLQGGTTLSTTLNAMDKAGPMARYVSDGNPNTVAGRAP
ncbi:MAG: polysaccharide deacetylase family protein [Gemmatimonadaceae bacterium]|nr:polysaccharide deacetylase family protein [Gemmatimonadaceae bacterium]